MSGRKSLRVSREPGSLCTDSEDVDSDSAPRAVAACAVAVTQLTQPQAVVLDLKDLQGKSIPARSQFTGATKKP